MTQGFLDNLVQWEFSRNGTTRKLPYRYYDVGSLAAIFSADRRKIKDLLPHSDLRPVEIFPGRGLVAFACFEYRKTDGLPYNEVSISFLVTFKKRQIPGLTAARMMLSHEISSYVWQLPVTTEQAYTGGFDLFAYPKFIAKIVFDHGDEWITCTLTENDQQILKFRGKILATKGGKITRYITYAVEDRIPLRADMVVNPIKYAESYGGGAMDLKVGNDHQICKVLNQIGLSKRALAYQFIPFNETILYPARNLPK